MNSKIDELPFDGEMQRMTKMQSFVLWACFTLYMLILVWVVLFHGTLETFNSIFDPDLRSLNFYPYFNGRESLLNVLIFVPLGVYVAALFGKKAFYEQVGIVIAITLVFEIVQYIFAIGTTDIMDVIHNTVGGCLGIIVGFLSMKMLKGRFYTIAVPLAAVATVIMTGIVLFVPLR